MTSSTLTDFLLFDFVTWKVFANKILEICKYLFTPVLVFSIIYDQSSERPDPSGIFRRFVIANLVILSLSSYYSPFAGFGITVGDSLIKDQKKGLIGNWNKIKKRVEDAAKLNNKKDVGVITVAKSLFKYNGSDAIEKAAMILIFMSLFLIKVIYSVVHYSTYTVIGMLAVLYIMPPFSTYLTGALKTVLYLNITAILVAAVLLFMNEIIQLQVDSKNFITGLENLAKFLVLCFVLLGTLAIGFFLVNGKGPESWAGRMGTMLSAGLAFKALGLGSKLLSGSANMGTNTIKAVSAPLTSAITTGLGAGLYVASKPLTSMAKGMLNAVGNNISEKSNRLKKVSALSELLNNYEGPEANRNTSEHSNFSLPNDDSSSPSHGRYESSLSNYTTDATTGKPRVWANANPINHYKASRDTTKSLVHDFKNKTKEKIGLPSNSKGMTLKEKAIFIADKRLNNIDKLRKEFQQERINKRLQTGKNKDEV